MASAAMAMWIARTEPGGIVAAFHDRCWRLEIAKRTTLDGACASIDYEQRTPDASLPIEDALARRLAVDAFVILTDNKAWAGDKHPFQALQRYRAATGIAAKLVLVAGAEKRLLAEGANDAFRMEIAGFDPSVPGVIANFVRQYSE
jgi:60 kDa SS-A/Ro ribonucleoprotein